jgi:transposase
MSHFKRIGIDTSKAGFTLHAVDEAGKAVLRVNLRRAQMVPFFRKHSATEIALEACGSSHHWARKLIALGHNVRLIPPQYVKPFVKRAKNDRNDAEAICEAAGRPGLRCVLAKSAEQQAQGMDRREGDQPGRFTTGGHRSRDHDPARGQGNARPAGPGD